MATKANFRLMAVVVMVVLIGADSAWADLTDGLIGNWKLDETSGTTAIDSAGGNNGTLVNGPVWTSGQIDGALDFDGQNDYVEIEEPAITTMEFTLSIWANRKGLSGAGNSGIIFEQRDDTVGNNHSTVLLYTGNNNASTNIRSSNGIMQSLTYPRMNYNQWHHYAITISASDFIFYIDGIEVNSTTNNQSGNYITSIDYVDLGRHRYDGSTKGYFDGFLDDVRIYNRALSAEEIEQLYQEGWPVLESIEIVGYDEIAEDSQAQYKAIAVYDNDSTKDITNSAEWSVEPNNNCSIEAGLLTTESIDLPEDVTITAQYSESDVSESSQKQVSIFPICPSGSALEFDGVDDYVKISDHDSLSFDNEVFSVSTWFETTAPSTPSTSSKFILYKGSNFTNREYFLCLDHSGRVNARIFKSGSKTIFNDIRTDMAYDDGDWHFAVVTSDGDELKLYVDGVLKGIASVTIDMANLGSNLYIGQYGGGIEDWYGYLDEVAIYNRALSGAEIQANMHKKLTGQEEGLVGYWDFDEGGEQIAYDSSPNGNNGVLGSTPEVDSSDPEWVESDAPFGTCYSVAVDIKPGSCPNPLNLASKGVLSVAILGTEDFEVTTIDPGSIFLESAPTIRSSYEDVGTAVADISDCGCTTDGADGFSDLVVKFKTQDIVEALINAPGQLAKGQVLTLTVGGELFDGSFIEGVDCVVLVGNVPRHLYIRISDINGDGVINMVDLTQLGKYWLESW